MTLRHTFCWFVSQWCKVLRCSIPGAEVPSFTNGQGGREKIGVPNIDIWQQQAIRQQSQLERLPLSVDRIAVKDKMQCPELPVGVHKYFEPEYEIQIPHVHYSKV